MATYIKTVDPNGGADYASLSAWEAGQQTLYSSGDIAIADCKRTGATKDTAQCWLSGWTAGVVPKIIGNNSYRAAGTQPYILEVSSGSFGAFISSVSGAVLDGIFVSGVGIAACYVNATNISISNCVCKNNGTDNTVIDAIGGLLVLNSIVYGASTSAGKYGIVGASGSPATIYNTTVIGGWIPIRYASVTKNCYAGGNSFGSDYFDVTTKITCASSDASSGSAGLCSIAVSTSTGAKFANITAGSEDFHIQSGSALIGVGTDLSSTFTTDIDGVTRSAPWDIGADQYVAAGGGSFTGTLAAIHTAQSQSLTGTLAFSGYSVQSQITQSQIISALLQFSGTTIQMQSANSEALVAALSFGGTIPQVQSQQSESLAGILGFSGGVAQTQAQQTQAIFQALTAISGAVSQSQAAQIASLTASLAFGGVSSQVQVTQSEALASVLSFAGVTVQSQQKQAETLTTLLSFGGNVTQAQATQIETLTAILAFGGDVAQTQAHQQQIISGFIKKVMGILSITTSNSLALYITARDPLHLNISN